MMSYAKQIFLITNLLDIFYHIRQVAKFVCPAGVHLGPPIWGGEEEVIAFVGVTDGTIPKSDGGCDHSTLFYVKLFYRIVSYCAISNHSAAVCRRMSPKLQSTGGVNLGKIWGGRFQQCKPNFNAVWKRHGAVVCKRKKKSCRCICRLSTIHEHDRQTDRQTDRPRNGNIDSNYR